MFCHKCGLEAEASRFCADCGEPLARPPKARSMALQLLAAAATVVAVAVGAAAVTAGLIGDAREEVAVQPSPSGTSKASPLSLSSTASPSSRPTPTASTSAAAPPTRAAAQTLRAGLFCRDLARRGYGYSDAVAYWHAQDQPSRMDADDNGIPCETVYSPADVSRHWGPALSAEPSAARPKGTLLVIAGPEGGFGQTFPKGRCAVWQTGFVNQSDTAIDQIIMAPPDGDYTNYAGWNGHDFPTKSAAPPSPAVLDIYLEAGARTALEYKTCTSTPPPVDPAFNYGATAPDTVEFRWVTGHRGTACFRC